MPRSYLRSILTGKQTQYTLPRRMPHPLGLQRLVEGPRTSRTITTSRLSTGWRTNPNAASVTIHQDPTSKFDTLYIPNGQLVSPSRCIHTPSSRSPGPSPSVLSHPDGTEALESYALAHASPDVVTAEIQQRNENDVYPSTRVQASKPGAKVRAYAEEAEQMVDANEPDSLAGTDTEDAVKEEREDVMSERRREWG